MLRAKFLFGLVLIAVLYSTAAYLAFRKFNQDFIAAQTGSQQRLTRVVSQYLELYFDKIKFIVENAASQNIFRPEETEREDALRFQKMRSSSWLNYFKNHEILKMMLNPHQSGDITDLPKDLFAWQIFKGLPEKTESGRRPAEYRRNFSQKIKMAYPEVHNIFQMNANGDLVFLEPFEVQKNLTSFNYSFRDYLQSALRLKRTAMSEGYVSHDKERSQLITVASPITDKKGNIKSIFALSISAQVFRSKIFANFKQQMEIDDGTVLYQLRMQLRLLEEKRVLM
jgi:hypothetical protein